MKQTHVMTIIIIGLVANAIAMGINVYGYFREGEISLAVIFGVVLLLNLVVVGFAITMKRKLKRQ
ncbi:hypothetical protein JNUCC1_02754 [Lentibacillus sp. JNUCC-1]|uniref:hypothetical protein n=1 Tax=Lentibacillus sp. JNUCC-1 TaxID=2654513 RepID=UPI0012E849D5|nr:hypothetical protein [Lentibacillus sp. JNUCC-1]MUV38883.1 hypothetical protein [Lentibacillus sp. JNUCC-1]